MIGFSAFEACPTVLSALVMLVGCTVAVARSPCLCERPTKARCGAGSPRWKHVELTRTSQHVQR
eukprot:1948643-Prymnesium_polylepis.1